ncbi:hypothetical protein ASJ81_10855 [Methanosarcina spelaei]|uniref:Uncharacterized protein n=1 Tax=Methanosarcina spelaei TaxID=1036679 RepID=A0A2A2HPJ7_9EURY|nr:hypothetical protein ASJ81_10855 [Methanosarcina spelaei]
MPGIDLKKENKELYNPSAKEVSIVDVPEMSFLMIDGEGDPNISQEFWWVLQQPKILYINIIKQESTLLV